MNIKILDSWLRDYVKTSATPATIAEKLSLTSVGIEHITKYKNDFVYDIEVTTNRPEMMSVVGIAREAATVLPQSGIKAEFKAPAYKVPAVKIAKDPELTIKNDPALVGRICAVVMEVNLKESPQYVKDRLESSDIRSLNNVIDVTNYVMREIGHPTHVFDYDRLTDHTLVIRESKKGEKVKTLDNKEYTLSGGDIVADNGKGEIIDLMGVMGTANSVVTNDTKRILFFIDNVEQNHIRKTSMEHGIRTEAAVLNEKGINPEYAYEALAAGIALFQKIANGKIISNIIDMYPNPPKATKLTLSEKKLHTVAGVEIPLKTAVEILTKLGFEVKAQDHSLDVTVPPYKSGVDMQIAEDLIEEIARIYGYHNIPNTLPAITKAQPFHLEADDFYWEDRVKDMLKYWGFTEVYTYPMVSKDLYKGEIENAVTIANPLTEEFVYMRTTLIPGLMKVVKDNQDHPEIKLFEIANIYEQNGKDLPKQLLRLVGIVAKAKVSFYEVKGVVEQLLDDLGITEVNFKHLDEGSRYGATVFIGKKEIGVIEMLSDHAVDFELEFDVIKAHAKLKKVYRPVSMYPAIIEDLALIAPANELTGDIMETIAKQSPLIVDVSLLDKYRETRTFHVVYQSDEKNLTDKEVGEIREKILKAVGTKHSASLK